MAELIPLLNNINWGNPFATVMVYIGYFLIVVVIIAIFLAFITYMTYNIKATTFKLYGSGKDGSYSISRPKTNRLRWTKGRNSMKPLFPLFNRKEIKPFDSDYIYSGNTIYAFILNGEWIPASISLDKQNKHMKAEFKPIPYEIRNWQSLQYKKNQLEFRSNDFWDNNKMLIMTIIAVAICCVLAGVTIYLTYKYALGGQANVKELGEILKNLNTIQGI